MLADDGERMRGKRPEGGSQHYPGSRVVDVLRCWLMIAPGAGGPDAAAFCAAEETASKFLKLP